MPDQNKHIMAEFYEKVVNTGNCEIMAQYVDSTVLPEIENHILAVRKTYPDLCLTINNQIAEGDMVVSCVTMTGTHQGEWAGIRPTGKSITVTAVNVDRLKNGFLIEHGGAANMLEALMEAGAVVPK